MLTPRKVAVTPVAVKFELECPWCDNVMYVAMPWDEVDGERVYDCDQCHRPYVLGEVVE